MEGLDNNFKLAVFTYVSSTLSNFMKYLNDVYVCQKIDLYNKNYNGMPWISYLFDFENKRYLIVAVYL